MGLSKIGQVGKSGLQKLADESNSCKEILVKLGLKPYGSNYDTLKKYFKIFEINTTKLDENREVSLQEFRKWDPSKKQYTLEQIIEKPGVRYQPYKLKKRLIDAGYKENKCEICGISEWMGKEISLQLHHKDGDETNNTLENLQILCPNCHSQTDNYAGKSTRQNKEKQPRKNRTPQEEITKPSREELKKDIRILGYRNTRYKYHVGDKKLREWCEEYGLPLSRDEIYSISDEDWAKL